MTRRDRLENKLEKRAEWAEKAKERGQARFDKADKMASVIPFGQPILVGHHSEKSDRNYRDRIHNNMTKGCEEFKLAEHHESKAHGLEIQLKRSIFSDDENAIQELEKRIAEREEEAASYVALNAAWRKSKGNVEVFANLSGLSLESAQATANAIGKAYSWEKQPIPAYMLSNLRGNIRRDKERIKEIQARIDKAVKAEAAGGVLIQEHPAGPYTSVAHVSITFAEKPDRSIINALKEAGFRWYSSCWYGEKEKMPDCIA